MKRKAEEETKESGDGGRKEKKTAVKEPVIVQNQDEYLEHRLALLEKEKGLTRMRDEVSKLRQELPWVEVTKDYIFDGPNGTSVTLQGLFKGKSQLVVQHFMFGPEWEAGCKSCSFMADHMSEAATKHLAAKDVSYVAIGRAPMSKLEAFQSRMGWKTEFYSSNKNDFDYDFGVAFRKEAYDKEGGVMSYNFAEQSFFMEDFPGISVFVIHDGKVFHTYSTYSRGLDPFITTYQFLDIVPKGRDEGDEKYKMSWLKLHDEY